MNIVENLILNKILFLINNNIIIIISIIKSKPKECKYKKNNGICYVEHTSIPFF